MRVDLRALMPNPMRDFTIDPMDPDIIARLKQSIEEDGFWGGIVCRRLQDGTLQIGAGHHRVAAALEAGITTADLFMADDMDDDRMVRVYARENATQRGHSSTALTGTVAAAMKYVAKGILTGTAQKFLREFDVAACVDVPNLDRTDAPGPHKRWSNPQKHEIFGNYVRECIRPRARPQTV
jgi:hypothetical protein